MTDAEPPRALLHPGRYGWLLGAVALAVIVVVLVNGAGTSGPGARGLPPGARLPPFAAPLATSAIRCDSPRDPCDANVATRAGQGSALRMLHEGLL